METLRFYRLALATCRRQRQEIKRLRGVVSDLLDERVRLRRELQEQRRVQW